MCSHGEQDIDNTCLSFAFIQTCFNSNIFGPAREPNAAGELNIKFSHGVLLFSLYKDSQGHIMRDIWQYTIEGRRPMDFKCHLQCDDSHIIAPFIIVGNISIAMADRDHSRLKTHPCQCLCFIWNVSYNLNSPAPPPPPFAPPRLA